MLPARQWQKSSFCAEGNNCLEVAVSGAGDPAVHLRESDAPGVVLTTSPARLAALLRAVKGDALRRFTGT